MTRVEQVIRSTWKPPKTDSKIIIKYAFNLNKFGSLSGLRLIKSGGEPLADAAALDALKAACFPESPDNAPDVISIEFTFEQNMGPKGPSLDDKRALITGFSALVGKENTAANYSWLAGAYELNGDKELAMQAYKKALEIDPNYSVAKYGINRLDKDVRDAGTPAQ
jgi:tetratricopeptide (TPR) repeat protein